MPIFDYKCRECEKEFEVFYTSQAAVRKEEKSEKCPACGSKKKQKMISKSTSFELKGKGWYKDGY